MTVTETLDLDRLHQTSPSEADDQFLSQQGAHRLSSVKRPLVSKGNVPIYNRRYKDWGTCIRAGIVSWADDPAPNYAALIAEHNASTVTSDEGTEVAKVDDGKVSVLFEGRKAILVDATGRRVELKDGKAIRTLLSQNEKSDFEYHLNKICREIQPKSTKDSVYGLLCAIMLQSNSGAKFKKMLKNRAVYLVRPLTEINES
jgi:hypothetical protein